MNMTLRQVLLENVIKVTALVLLTIKATSTPTRFGICLQPGLPKLVVNLALFIVLENIKRYKHTHTQQIIG